MTEKLAHKILLHAFNDELEKIAQQRQSENIEKWASATFHDWDDLTDMQKQAFIGKMMKSVGKAFGMGKPAAGKAIMQKAKPLVDFAGEGKALAGTAALKSQKQIPRVGDITFR